MTDARTGAPPGAGRLAILIGGVVVAIAIATVAIATFGGPGRQVETGIVLSVDAVSLSDVRGFSIRTADGRTVAFRIGRLENAATFAPGHLAENKATLAPVRVTYVDENGTHTAVRIEDAP